MRFPISKRFKIRRKENLFASFDVSRFCLNPKLDSGTKIGPEDFFAELGEGK